MSTEPGAPGAPGSEPAPSRPRDRSSVINIQVTRETHARLRSLARQGEAANDVVFRLLQLHSRQITAGGLSKPVEDLLFQAGFAGQALDDIAVMLFHHFTQCKGAGGAGTIAGYVQMKEAWNNFRQRRESWSGGKRDSS